MNKKRLSHLIHVVMQYSPFLENGPSRIPPRSASFRSVLKSSFFLQQKRDPLSKHCENGLIIHCVQVFQLVLDLEEFFSFACHCFRSKTQVMISMKISCLNWGSSFLGLSYRIYTCTLNIPDWPVVEHYVIKWISIYQGNPPISCYQS